MATAQHHGAQHAASVGPDEHEEAKVALKKDWEEAVRKTRPRDAAQGAKSGLATAAAGVASGFVGLFAAPIVGARQDGAAGFAKGLATGEEEQQARSCSCCVLDRSVCGQHTLHSLLCAGDNAPYPVRW